VKLRLQAVHDGRTIECETSLLVLVEWERKYKRRTGDLAQGFALEDLAYLAWASIKRTEKLPQFDTWLEKLQSVDVLGGEDANPTDAAATAGS
jgi:hypothetical protein